MDMTKSTQMRAEPPGSGELPDNSADFPVALLLALSVLPMSLHIRETWAARIRNESPVFDTYSSSLCVDAMNEFLQFRLQPGSA